MKKLLLNNLIIIFFFLLIIGCNKEKPPYQNDLYKLKIIGKVKSMEFVKYEDFDEGNKEIEESKEIRMKYTLSFDSYGNEIEYKLYNKSERIEKRRIKEYDKKGNLTNIILYDSVDRIVWRGEKRYDIHKNIVEENVYDDKQELFTKESFKYNENNDLVERVVFKEEVEVYKELVNYDKNGNKVERKLFDKNPNGEFYLDVKNSYDYDNLGNLIESSIYRFEYKEELLKSYTEKYDSRGNVIENITFELNGSVGRRITNKFDRNNNKIERLKYNDGVLKEKNIYKYDNNGNVKEEVVFWDDKLVLITKYKYDENDGMIEFYSKNPTKENIRIYDNSYEIEYDGNDNWIKQFEYIDKKLISISERRFEYF